MIIIKLFIDIIVSDVLWHPSGPLLICHRCSAPQIFYPRIV